MAKIRVGFVSNSSSSSFVVPKYFLSQYQLDAIERKNDELGYDSWSIDTDEFYVKFFTDMDNFDMASFLEDIGVPEDKIKQRGW